MGYPSLEIVQLFAEIAHRDGFEEISENLLLKYKNPKMIPLLSYFKQVIVHMLENEMHEEADGYTSGFLACLDIFRRQINYETVSLEEIETQLSNIEGWNNFLEIENLELRNQIIELTRRNQELQELPTPPIHGNLPDSS